MKTPSRFGLAAVVTVTIVGGSWQPATAQGPNPAAGLGVGGVYTQSFDELRSSGNGQINAVTGAINSASEPFTTAAAPGLVGWRFRRNSADWFMADSGFNAGTLTVGGEQRVVSFHSYGDVGATDRAIGFLSANSGATNNNNSFIGLVIRNNTGQTLNSVTVNYTGEQWRTGGRGDASTDQLDFSYQIGVNEITGPGFTDVDALDFVSKVTGTTTAGELNGNDPANQRNITHTIAFGGGGWADGTDLVVRWTDPAIPGLDDGLAIDNFRIELTPIPEPGAVLLACALTGGAAVVRRRFRRVG
jgi:hypothetical protein